MTAAADRMRSKRQAFAAPGSSLDKVVRALAVGLPALVGVVAALMLITPLGPRGEVSFLLDRNKVAVADDRLRVDNAMYRGEDGEGRPFSLIAGSAVQQSNSVPVVEMRELTARLLLPEGPAVLSAPEGSYDIDDEQVGIPGTVRFTASDGYEFTASNVTINLLTRTLMGEGGIRGEIPAGTFQADSMQADMEARTFTLTGNVRGRMVPGQLRMPSGMSMPGR
ncbi:LPS export ABC transporter periplasmic protein LptC [Aurantiacibacter sp. MUD61]|uniref:LPS export ABC transporter periplasmic protein LptC n=1 Tax=Aurantiacibacter sp. MUD61 TaxID=3009083 RepID=UPI0022F0D4CD|nr:LPS export ABC transporter periplasmic protein LptC [Aurantiacibacter sp. MUD61]